MNSLNVQRLIYISVIKYETITRPASFIDQLISDLTYFNFLNYYNPYMCTISSST